MVWMTSISGKNWSFQLFWTSKREPYRKIKKTSNQFNRASASHFHYPKIKADLKSPQQEMRVLKMTKRCGDRRVIVCSRSALNRTLFSFSLYQGERMSKRTDWTIELTNETNEKIILFFIIWLCLTRTGNYQIHEFDWLKWILTAV